MVVEDSIGGLPGLLLLIIHTLYTLIYLTMYDFKGSLLYCQLVSYTNYSIGENTYTVYTVVMCTSVKAILNKYFIIFNI